MQFVRSTPFCSIGKRGIPSFSLSRAVALLSWSVNGRIVPPFSIFHFGAEQKNPVWFTDQVDTSFSA